MILGNSILFVFLKFVRRLSARWLVHWLIYTSLSDRTSDLSSAMCKKQQKPIQCVSLMKLGPPGPFPCGPQGVINRLCTFWGRLCKSPTSRRYVQLEQKESSDAWLHRTSGDTSALFSRRCPAKQIGMCVPILRYCISITAALRS